MSLVSQKYTSSLDDFRNRAERLYLRNHSAWGFEGFSLGQAGRTIHSSESPSPRHMLFSSLPTNPELFSPGKHLRRIAIFGVGVDAQIALMPSTARVGDLVAAVSTNLLPVILRPRGWNQEQHNTLVPNPDQYTALGSSARMSFRAKVEHSGMFLIQGSRVFIVAFGLFSLIPLGATMYDLIHRPRAEYSIGSTIEYLALSAIVLPLAWYTFTRDAVEKTASKRRDHVLGVLDNIAQTAGPHCEFHGPVFVDWCVPIWNCADDDRLNRDNEGVCLERPVQHFQVY
jgi:hypothetical protein